MFSLFSNWRQTFSSPYGEGDDASSLNRSLTLPWPVTESSPRRNKNEGTPTQQQELQQLRQLPVNSVGMREISHPIPKTALKSLTTTRPDDHPAVGVPGPTPPSTGIIGTVPSLHPFIAAPIPPSESVPWYLESAEKRRNNNNSQRTALLQANAHTQHAPSTTTPPEVVRLDNNDNLFADVETTNSQMPLVDYHDASTSHHTSYDYATYPYANGISNPGLYANQYAHQTPHDEHDEHEIYTSPFEHSDDEDAFFRAPLPKQTATASTAASRWGGLKLHTASPFSQSTLRVDGVVFPPADTSSHQTLPLLPPSLPATPPIPTVNTDVYNHAYNYPLAKQLSPIAEQDYLSPVSVKGLPGSAGGSPGSDSVLHFGFVNGKERITAEGDGDKERDRERDWERASTRTRSVRTGSAGSAKVPAMTGLSRSGSLSMWEAARELNPSPSGSMADITRPSPIYASPFITRHLNRTISQTSSNKSDSPSQAQFQLPAPAPPATVVPAPAPPAPQSQAAPQCDVPSITPTLSRMTSQPSMGTISSTPRLSTVTITPANAYLKSSGLDTTIAATVQTPTSAVTTTTGSMYTPSSAFPTPTPISPTSAGSGIQIPAPAVVILPCIPPLDFRPFFPGPHPSPDLSDSELPRLRPPKMLKKRGDGHRLSMIRGSRISRSVFDDEGEIVDDEDGEEEGGGYDVESLHADSFVTATTSSNEGDDDEDDENDEKPNGRELELTILPKGKSASVRSNRIHTSQLPSAAMSNSGDSFITRRWERDAALGLSLSPTTFRERKHRFFSSNSSFITNLTPAFWAFWLGFIFPVLWLVGGWLFTNLGEQPPKSTVWGWYFWRMRNGWGFGWWRRAVAGWWCFGMRKGVEGLQNHKRGGSQEQQQMQIQMQQVPQRRIPPRTRPRTKSLSNSHSQLRSGKVFPALPQWVAEKQNSDECRMKLNDPKRSLKGISFGYPFISRPPYSQGSTSLSSPPSSSVGRRVLMWIEKPNRVLDQLYGVKLREVQGRPESGRRMFDPWIQRCRYAFCWIVLVVAIGLCTTSAYLIVTNTRKL